MPDAVFSRNAAPPLLLIKNLSCAYAGRGFGGFGKKEIRPVLEGVNLEIAAGELFGLVGESGCGKTTLARCVLGLIDYQGEIRIDGERRTADGGRHLERARKAQMVFQESGASLNPAKKIGWLMEEPLLIHKLSGTAERRRKVDAMLVRVGLDPSYKNRRVHELSGGQKQRVCIGRSLMLEPKLLIADEALSSLDVSVGAQILNLFRELHESLGLSMLFISHNTGAVEYLCGRIAVMREGRITEIRANPWGQ
jgi:ABC-type glutathione transport system ATPase component